MAMHVAVAGAGIVGASIAWRLAQRGCRITLLDAGAMGGEASWAGAGMLAPGGEVTERSAWSELALESAGMYPEFVRELCEESGVAIDYRACGAVELGGEDAARVSVQAELGIASFALAEPPAGVVRPPGDAARWFPGDAIVDPRDVMRALQAALLARGAAIRTSSPVSRVEWQNGRALLTAAVPLEADAAVLAAGAWSSSVAAFDGAEAIALPPSFPVRGHLLGYRLAPGLLAPIVRRDHTYLLQRSSGFLIAGASAERAGFDRTIDPAIVATLRANAEALLPALRGREPEAWIGFRPATPSLQPEIRCVEGTGIWLAYGHYRNGILLAPATAARVAAGVQQTLDSEFSCR